MADIFGPDSKKKPKRTPLKQKQIEWLRQRNKIYELKKQEYTKKQIAEMLEIDESTVTRSMQALEKQALQEFRDHVEDKRKIIAGEYEKICYLENICAQRLERTKAHPERGSRWAEEWRKLMERKARMLGLDSAQKYEHAIEENPATKEQRDAAVQAALRAAQINKELKLDEDSETAGNA